MAFTVGSSIDDKDVAQVVKPKSFKVAKSTDEVIVVKQCKCIVMPFGSGGLVGYVLHNKYMYERLLINNNVHYRVYKDYDSNREDNAYNQIHYIIFNKYFKSLNPP